MQCRLTSYWGHKMNHGHSSEGEAMFIQEAEKRGVTDVFPLFPAVL